jgi:hypothetical protein
MRTWLSLLWVWLWALPASATVIVALPEAELIKKADTIVIGTVIRTETVLHEGGRVATQAWLQVYRGLRGAATESVIRIEVPGGRFDNGLLAFTPGSPALAGGDFVFGFLETHGEVRRPLGMSYGLLRIRKAGDGSWRVFRETDGLTMLSPAGLPAETAVVTIRDLPLETLVRRVEARLRELGIEAPGTVAP